LRFKWKGRASRIKLGVFPTLGIAQARELASAYRRELENGIDPLMPRGPDCNNHSISVVLTSATMPTSFF